MSAQSLFMELRLCHIIKWVGKSLFFKLSKENGWQLCHLFVEFANLHLYFNIGFTRRWKQDSIKCEYFCSAGVENFPLLG